MPKRGRSTEDHGPGTTSSVELESSGKSIRAAATISITCPPEDRLPDPPEKKQQVGKRHLELIVTYVSMATTFEYKVRFKFLYGNVRKPWKPDLLAILPKTDAGLSRILFQHTDGHWYNFSDVDSVVVGKTRNIAALSTQELHDQAGLVVKKAHGFRVYNEPKHFLEWAPSSTKQFISTHSVSRVDALISKRASMRLGVEFLRYENSSGGKAPAHLPSSHRLSTPPPSPSRGPAFVKSTPSSSSSSSSSSASSSHSSNHSPAPSIITSSSSSSASASASASTSTSSFSSLSPASDPIFSPTSSPVEPLSAALLSLRTPVPEIIMSEPTVTSSIFNSPPRSPLALGGPMSFQPDDLPEVALRNQFEETLLEVGNVLPEALKFADGVLEDYEPPKQRRRICPQEMLFGSKEEVQNH